MAEAKRRILVVDDDPDSRALVRLHLEGAGYAVVELDNPTSAIAHLETDNIDLVVLDVMMPQMDGFELLGRIREIYGSHTLPVIMLTSRDSSSDVIRAMRLGASDYATKGPDLSVLLQRTRVHMDLKRPRTVLAGPYRLLGKLGSGSMGMVYEARRNDDDERAAIKLLPRSMAIDDMYVRRFLREAEVASRVHHRNVVRLFETGRYEETYYIAMELVDGKNLRDHFGAEPVDAAVAVDIIAQVAAGLRALHEASIVHRDIKPHNILLTRGGLAKITDFGIARDQIGTRYTATGFSLGSPAYAAPEQLAGDCDYRADIYSLGATLYFLLTGASPYPTGSPNTLYREKMRGPPNARRLNADIPRHLARLMAKMMAARPEGRYDDHETLSEHIATALKKLP